MQREGVGAGLATAGRVGHAAIRHAQNMALLLRRGAGDEVWKEVRARLSSSLEYVVLCRDLGVPFATPRARLSLHLRPFRAGDERVLLDISDPRLSGPDLRARLSRRRLLQQGIGTPYVAVTNDDRPVFVEWLFLPADSERLAAFSRDFFPRLEDTEAIIEGAFTVEAARGQGVMAWAQAEIARLAGDLGAGRVLMFVTADNAASLKGSQRAGFVPCGRQYERWRLFQRSVDRMPLDPATAPKVVSGHAG